MTHSKLGVIVYILVYKWVQAQYSGQLLILAKVHMKLIENYVLFFNFVKEIIKVLKIFHLQGQLIYVDKNNIEKVHIFLKDVVSGMQVGNIEQLIV